MSPIKKDKKRNGKKNKHKKYSGKDEHISRIKFPFLPLIFAYDARKGVHTTNSKVDDKNSAYHDTMIQVYILWTIHSKSSDWFKQS